MNNSSEYLHVTCSTDDNYVQHCMAMLCSLFENNKECRFVVHLLHQGLSVENEDLISSLCLRYKNDLKQYLIDSNNSNQFSIAENHPDLSIVSYFRLFLPSILPRNIHRILYLDCDVIVVRNITRLFTINMKDYGVAAVQDVTPNSNYHRQIMGLSINNNAFCAGVMMINLDFWRENKSGESMIAYANTMRGKLIMEDQDVLNHEFHGHWLKLPYKYGRTPLAVAPVDFNQKWFDIYEYVNEPSIFHYAAHVKPWLDVWFPERNHYWHFVKLSGLPKPKKTHASKQLKIKIYKSVMRYIINKYIRPFIPDIIEIILKDIYYSLLCIVYILRPNKLNSLMLKRWCQKYRML